MIVIESENKNKDLSCTNFLDLVTESAPVMVHKRSMRRSHVAYSSKHIVSLTMT